MRWFGNRNNETKEKDTPEVKPRNQILQTPEDKTSESKSKLDRYQNKTPEQQKKIQESQKKTVENHQKLDRPKKSTEGENRGAREREIGR